MSKIFKKIFNGLLFIKNFLIILFELKSHSTKMYEFLDDILSKMGEGDLNVKTQMTYDLHELLNQMYGVEYSVEHMTLANKFMNKMFNLKEEKDVIDKIRISIKNSLDLKTFIREFIK